MICVDCGNEADRLIRGSCADCFVGGTTLLDLADHVHLELCASCGARHVGAHWHDVEPDTPEQWVREQAMIEAAQVHQEVQGTAFEIAEKQLDERTFTYELHLRGKVDSVPVEAMRTSLLRRIKGVCNRCSRIAGGYYASIIQLRATDRDVTAAELARAHSLMSKDLTRQLDNGNRFAFLAKGGPMHGGWDYYIGDIDAGRNVSRLFKDRLGALVTETAKLVGKQEGDDVYRVTFLVRVRLFAQGDFALLNDKLHLVTAVHPKNVQLLNLEDFLRTRSLESNLSRYGGEEEVEEAIVVTRRGMECQVLDPQSFIATDLRVPDDAEVGETVRVVRREERLYWAPRANKS